MVHNFPFTMPTDITRTSSIKDDILLNTMQLVEPIESHTPVPNHLLDTKIYRKTGQNEAIAATPADVHFSGFQLGKKCTSNFCIKNVCGDVISINILPPQSKYFKLHYKKPTRMIPGISLNCEVEFVPEEWRYYYDCIRINCPGEENLVIPIHAYPVMNRDGFPKFYRFPPVPVGESRQTTFTLSCDVFVDFEFKLELLQSNKDFTVEPMEGIVPANGSVGITVTFSPSEFQTSCIQLKLRVSQFNSKPIVCTICGSSTPGLQKEKEMKDRLKTSKMLSEREMLDPQAISPLDRARTRKQTATKTKKKVIEYKNVPMPLQTISVHTVAKVLSEKTGQMRAKDLRDALLRSKDGLLRPSKQMKEAAFKNAVQQMLSDERQNQLRWQSKIGGEPMSETSKALVLEKRNESWEVYRIESDQLPIAARSQTEVLEKRSSRLSTEIPEKLATFDPYSNNLWHQKLYIQQRFVQIVRKLILQNRAVKNMTAFKALLNELKGMKYDEDLITQCLKRRVLKEKSEQEIELFHMKMQINQYQNDFITVDPPEQLYFERISQNTEKQLDVRERTTVPYFELTVPQYYKLQEYITYDVHKIEYLSPDPFTFIDMKQNLVKSNTPGHTRNTPVKNMQPRGPTIQEFKMPRRMLEPPEYQPEHIFNPLPSVQSFEIALPYSEGDADYNICPIPRFPQTNPTNVKYFSTQKQFLNKENVIHGVMTWKKFPSPSLMGIFMMPSLGNNWIPSHEEKFKSGVFPKEMPAMRFHLPPTVDLMKNEVERQQVRRLLDTSKANLIPEAVNEEFKLHTDADVRKNRYDEEEELTNRISQEFDQLGTRIQEKITYLSDFATDQELLFR